jgi:acyl-CoA synthetase (AMP-forming)/AMP-acid ligase II
MATRYHDDEEASLRAFRNGWFYPGDVGHFGEQGDLRFDGRLDEMMMLASINIFPAEIERFAETLPGVRECAAFSIKSGEFGDVPLLAVVSDGTTGAEALLAAARRALGLRAPRKVFLVDELPRTAEGKIRRADLRKLAEERAAA